MKNEQFINLISKKLSNDISKEESIELESLLENPKHKNIHDDLQLKWTTSGKLAIKHNPNTEKSWQAFKEKAKKVPAKQIKLIPRLYKVAAVAVLAFGIGYFYFQQTPLLITEHSTSQGEIKEIILPDSSAVWLNESSYLSYNENFNEEERQVTLEGEAYFEVEKNTEKPFIIIANRSLTKVIGTSFNISANQNEQTTSINVNSGIVAFSDIESNHTIRLVKGESAQLNTQTLSINKTAVQNPNYAAWRTKSLLFEDTDLLSVIHDLNKYYDVNIEFDADAIGHCKLTSYFSNPTIDEVLEVLKITLDISSTKTSNGYLLIGQGCSN